MMDEDTVGFSAHASISTATYTHKSRVPITFVDNTGVPRKTAEELTAAFWMLCY